MILKENSMEHLLIVMPIMTLYVSSKTVFAIFCKFPDVVRTVLAARSGLMQLLSEQTAWISASQTMAMLFSFGL